MLKMGLTKAGIVEQVFKQTAYSRKEAINLVEELFLIIKKTLAQGEKVKISGFGNFSIRDKASRLGRNPQTGETLEILSRRVLTFRPSSVLKEDIINRFCPSSE